MMFLDPRLPSRFWEKCIPEPNSGCWLWIGATDRAGYGRIQRGRPVIGTTGAHRFAYLALSGDVPVGLDLDNLCRTPCCVNPSHLEPVTRSTNVRRGLRPAQLGREVVQRGLERTHCKHGHLLDVQNTYIRPDNGRRQCCVCRVLRKAEFDLRYAQRRQGVEQ